MLDSQVQDLIEKQLPLYERHSVGIQYHINLGKVSIFYDFSGN